MGRGSKCRKIKNPFPLKETEMHELTEILEKELFWRLVPKVDSLITQWLRKKAEEISRHRDLNGNQTLISELTVARILGLAGKEEPHMCRGGVIFPEVFNKPEPKKLFPLEPLHYGADFLATKLKINELISYLNKEAAK